MSVKNLTRNSCKYRVQIGIETGTCINTQARTLPASCLGYATPVTAADGATRVPIFHFSTQQRPILLGLVRSTVLRTFAEWTIDQFCGKSLPGNVRQGLATVFKATVIRGAGLLTELFERCGWQGLFAYNQIIELALTFQGNSIAEGDTLVLCIRE